ncbi:MAG TPA: hypothetical protein PKO09_17965 [Anaerolineae bacterium]|nr:hypothetical protein [Anaerolineae bacterium]
MIRLLLLLAILGSGLSSGRDVTSLPLHSALPPAAEAAPAQGVPRAGASTLPPYAVYLPLAARTCPCCEPIPGVVYESIDVLGPPATPPAEQHPDLNLALRGYLLTDAFRGLVDYGGGFDPLAPQLYTLFADQRVPLFPSVSQVYDWDWEQNCRGEPLDDWDVTLAGMAVAPGEVLALPDSGYTIGQGYEALVLYASETRITLKYTREDNVVYGFTIHVENVCVEPSLLALYRACNDQGRGQLPALRGNQPFGRAQGTEIGVAIRDAGTFLDPRSRKDWWQGQ